MSADPSLAINTWLPYDGGTDIISCDWFDGVFGLGLGVGPSGTMMTVRALIIE